MTPTLFIVPLLLSLLSSLSLTHAQSIAPSPAAAAAACNGIFLSYAYTRGAQLPPTLKSNPTRQPYRFESTVTILNNGLDPLKSWKVWVGFTHEEYLVSASNAILSDGTSLPAGVGNGTVFVGYPSTDLETAIETAGDLTQMSTRIDLVGTQFGVGSPNIPMPANISLANDGFVCPKPTLQEEQEAELEEQDQWTRTPQDRQWTVAPHGEYHQESQQEHQHRQEKGQWKDQKITDIDQCRRGGSSRGHPSSGSSRLRTSVSTGRVIGIVRPIMARASLATSFANPNRTKVEKLREPPEEPRPLEPGVASAVATWEVETRPRRVSSNNNSEIACSNSDNELSRGLSSTLSRCLNITSNVTSKFSSFEKTGHRLRPWADVIVTRADVTGLMSQDTRAGVTGTRADVTRAASQIAAMTSPDDVTDDVGAWEARGARGGAWEARELLLSVDLTRGMCWRRVRARGLSSGAVFEFNGLRIARGTQWCVQKSDWDRFLFDRDRASYEKHS
ncbi:COBRA-like protein-7 precursor [Actinidia rufa]|uniref:COBRA-like protein-7 n=1 Tax=Actinidia rufa TaxID=165716 RepID=A0A7J0HF73_9ERIC|nr:COBRA-like protein-7 precursor [Actinidia rufa]